MDSKLVYNNCSELPIFNFFEIVRNQDFSMLLRDKNSEVDEAELFSLLTDIMHEYNGLTENTKLMSEQQARLDIDYLEAKYNLTKKILSLYLEYDSIEILLTLSEFGWQINTSEDIEPQLKRIHNVLIGIKNKIKIKKANFLKKFQKKFTKDNPNFNLEKQLIYLETGIPLGYKIDMHKDSISRYVYYNKILEDKNKQLSNG